MSKAKCTCRVRAVALDGIEYMLPIQYGYRIEMDVNCPQIQAMLSAETKKLYNNIAALETKVEALAPHGTCGCSYDDPDDLCMHHSPQMVKALAEAKRQTWEAAFKAQCPRCRDGEPLIGRLHLDTFNGNKNLCSASALRARAEQEGK